MKKGSFKKLFIGALAVAVMFSMSACGNATGTADGSASKDSSASDSGKTKLYVVNWKDYGSDDKDLIKKFEEENDCEIVNTYMQSEDDLLTKLKTSRDRKSVV